MHNNYTKHPSVPIGLALPAYVVTGAAGGFRLPRAASAHSSLPPGSECDAPSQWLTDILSVVPAVPLLPPPRLWISSWHLCIKFNPQELNGTSRFRGTLIPDSRSWMIKTYTRVPLKCVWKLQLAKNVAARVQVGAWARELIIPYSSCTHWLAVCKWA